MDRERRGDIKWAIIGLVILCAIGALIAVLVNVLPFLFSDGGLIGNNGDNENENGEVASAEYQIFDFSFDKETATATAIVQVYGDAVLAVRLADEDAFFAADDLGERKYIEGCYAEVAVTIPDTEPKTEYVKQTLRLSLPCEMPEHFVAVAMLTGEMPEVSVCAVDITNTERYEEFQNVRPEDFSEGDTVISFDQSGFDNFGVLADGVKVIGADEIGDVLAEENADGFVDTYTLTRPTASVAVGDKIYVSDGERAILICVSSISVDGDVTVVGAQNAEDGDFYLCDFYKFIRADMMLYDPEAEGEAQPLSSLEGEESGDFSKAYRFKNVPFAIETKYVEFKGLFKNIGFDVSVSYTWAPEIFGDDYFECKVKGKADLTVDLDVTAGAGSKSTAVEESFNLKNSERFAKIPIPTPIVGLNLKVEISRLLSYSASLTLSMRDIDIAADMGFDYNTVAGFNPGDCEVEVEIDEDDLEVYGDVVLMFGPTVSIGVEFISGLISAEVGGAYGVSLRTGSTMTETYTHPCEFCLDGHVDFLHRVNAVAKLTVLPKVQLVLKEVKLVDEDITDVYTFYISKKDSESKIEIGEGICPNQYDVVCIHSDCYHSEKFFCHMETDTSYQNELHSAGMHEHHTFTARIVLYNSYTGEVYYDDTLCTTYDYDNYKHPDYYYHSQDSDYLDVLIPYYVREISFRVEYVCAVVECPIYEFGKIGGSHPERTVTHTVEGTLRNETYYCSECQVFYHTKGHGTVTFKSGGVSDYYGVYMSPHTNEEHNFWCSQYTGVHGKD